jgi:hypothetical protein
MKKVSFGSFLKNYIELALVMILIYFISGPSENTSLPLVLLLGLPLTAIIVLTGLDKKLEKYLP